MSAEDLRHFSRNSVVFQSLAKAFKKLKKQESALLNIKKKQMIPFFSKCDLTKPT